VPSWCTLAWSLVHPGLVELLVLHVVDPVVGHRACLALSPNSRSNLRGDG
jgi:hypothetical protein